MIPKKEIRAEGVVGRRSLIVGAVPGVVNDVVRVCRIVGPASRAAPEVRADYSGRQTRTDVNGVVIDLRVGVGAAVCDDRVDIVLTDVVTDDAAVGIVTGAGNHVGIGKPAGIVMAVVVLDESALGVIVRIDGTVFQTAVAGEGGVINLIELDYGIQRADRIDRVSMQPGGRPIDDVVLDKR